MNYYVEKIANFRPHFKREKKLESLGFIEGGSTAKQLSEQGLDYETIFY